MTEKTVWLIAKQKGIFVKHVNPSFMYRFDDKPVEVPKEVYDYLKKTQPDLFEVVEKPKETKPAAKKEEKTDDVKSFTKLPELEE